MPRFGVQAATFAQGWNGPAALRAVESSAHLGFDALEIPLFHANLQTNENSAQALHAALRNVAHKAHITLVGRTALPRGCSVVRQAERARVFLGEALRTAAALGATTLGGALLYAPGDMEAGVGAGDGALLVEVLADLADEAEACGVMLALEPSHRFESHVANGVAQVQALVHAVGSDFLRLGLSTLQLHIDEPSPAEALRCAGPLLHSVRAVENTGGLPGSGAVQWAVLWDALREMNFDGLLILDAPRGFSDNATSVKATYISRMVAEMELYPEEFAAQGLAFLREGITGKPTPATAPRRRAVKQAPAESAPAVGEPAPPAVAQGKPPRVPARAPALRPGSKSYRSD